MNDASILLRRYARDRDEDAFRQLVARYFNFVHGIAARRLGENSSDAMDVAQIVFADLAQQARTLRDDSQIGGWLHSHTCFVAAKCIRSETRRAAREQKAVDMNVPENHSQDPWPAIAPVIDEALQDLTEPDRAAILLRYFEGRDLRAVGEVLSVSDDAAQKRVQRALERLKTALERRGLPVAVAALAALLLANASPAIASPPIAAISTKAAADIAAKQAVGFEWLAMSGVVGVLVLALSLVYSLSRTASKTIADRQTPVSVQKFNRPATDVAPTSLTESTPAGPVLILHVVSKATGHPIRGADVRATTIDPRSSIAAQEKGEIRFITDANGIARIPISTPAPDRLVVQTSAPDHGSWASIWEKYKGEEIPSEFTISLDAGIPLGGRVVDNAGFAVEGAEVRLLQNSRNGVGSNPERQRATVNMVTNVTDAAGNWSAHHVVEPFLDSIAVSIRHADFLGTNVVPNARALSELREGVWTIALQNGLSVSGRVANDKGEALTGATVRFGSEGFAGRKEAITDSEGRYHLKGLPGGLILRHEFASARAPGYAPASKSLDEKSMAQGVNFILSAPATIRARVLNAEGEPLKHIRVSREFNANKDGLSFQFETDGDGRFVWTESPNEPQSFYFLAPGYQQLRNKILIPGDEERIVILQKDVQLVGTVKDSLSGKPIPEFSISQDKGASRFFNSSYDRTFQNGSFEVALGESDFDTIRVRARGYTLATIAIPSTHQFDVRLEPSASMEGTVIDAAGQPIAGVEVASMVREEEQNPTLQRGMLSRGSAGDRALTDVGGHFKLSLSSEPISIVAVHSNGGFAQRFAKDFQKLPQLRLAPWGRIEGTIRSNDIPVPGISLSLHSFDSAARLDSRFYSTTPDEQGRFMFEFVPPGNTVIGQEGLSRRMSLTHLYVPTGAAVEVPIDLSR